MIQVFRITLYLQDSTAEGYGVLINFRRRDANGPRIMKITSLGHTLPYDQIDRLRTHCIDGCQRAEVGLITLNRAVFEKAASVGLPIRVWGERGRAERTIPAEAFNRVLHALEFGQ